MISKGDSLYFGLRCKVVAQPDNIFALWISLAVRFYKLQKWSNQIINKQSNYYPSDYYQTIKLS